MRETRPLGSPSNCSHWSRPAGVKKMISPLGSVLGGSCWRPPFFQLLISSFLLLTVLRPFPPSQAWNTWRMGRACQWTTTPLTPSSAGIPMTTSMAIAMTAWRVGRTGGFLPLSKPHSPSLHTAQASAFLFGCDTLLGSQGRQRRGRVTSESSQFSGRRQGEREYVN